jgi:phosphatidylglycerophosphatase A
MQKQNQPKFDWANKARSRIWSPSRGISSVPKFALLIGTFFYSGLSPVASGTAGSLVAAILYFFIPGLHNLIILIFAGIVPVYIAGVWSGGVVERALGTSDPGIVVIDEVFGQWIALAFGIGYELDIRFIILAFIFFRIFDVLKPPPARFFERKPGGTGIMLDDGVAGIYAGITARIIMYLIS